MIQLPLARRSPLRSLAVRVALAVALVLVTVAIIYIDRAGYRDINNDGLSLLDCFYYAVVTLSTTGYGDITPITQDARLVNVLVITPARVLFLIILVGTTLEVLTDQYRNSLRVGRWSMQVERFSKTLLKLTDPDGRQLRQQGLAAVEVSVRRGGTDA